MNHKTLRTWKPRLTADEEKVVEEGLRLLLFATTKAWKKARERGDQMLKMGLEMKIDQVIAASRSLQLDVDNEEECEKEEEHTGGRSEEV